MTDQPQVRREQQTRLEAHESLFQDKVQNLKVESDDLFSTGMLAATTPLPTSSAPCVNGVDEPAVVADNASHITDTATCNPPLTALDVRQGLRAINNRLLNMR